MTIKTSHVENSPSFFSESFYKVFNDIFEPLLDELNIPRAVLTDSKTEIPLAKHCMLLELAAKRQGDENLGLRIGSELHPRDMGPLGYAVLNSPTVLVALQNLARYLHVYARGCDMELKVVEDFAYFTFSYTIIDPSPVGRRQEAECTLAMVKNVIEFATESKLNLEEVYFEHPSPDSSLEHKRIFGAPIYFGKNVNRIKFHKKALEKRLVHHEPRLYELLEEHLRDSLESQSQVEDLLVTVGNMISKSLSNGIPSVDDVADKLYMSKRTLQRRLNDKGVHFNQYADEIRCKMAQQYVEKTNLPLTEIAYLLGYAQISAFSRAFRRWTGKTPHSFRIDSIN
jgi:AraC-like DNA-binding protein